MAKPKMTKDKLTAKLAELSSRLGEVRGALLASGTIDSYLGNQLDSEAHAYSDFVIFSEYCLEQQALLHKYLDIGEELQSLHKEIEYYSEDPTIGELYQLMVLNHDAPERLKFGQANADISSPLYDSPYNYGYNEIGKHLQPLVDDLQQKREAFLRAERLQGLVERLVNPALQKLIQFNQIYLPQFYPSTDSPDQLVEFRLQALSEINAMTMRSYDDPQELIDKLAAYGILIDNKQASDINLAAASAEDKLAKAKAHLLRIMQLNKDLSAQMRSIDPTADQQLIQAQLDNVIKIKAEREELQDDLEVMMGEIVDLKELLLGNVALKAEYESLTHKIHRSNALYDQVLQHIDLACAPLFEAEQLAMQSQLLTQQQISAAVARVTQLDTLGGDISALLSAIDTELAQHYWSTFSPQLQNVQARIDVLYKVAAQGGQLRNELSGLTDAINSCRGEYAQDHDRLIALQQRLLSNPMHQVDFPNHQDAQKYQKLLAFHQRFSRGNVTVADVYNYINQPEVSSFIKNNPQALHLVRAIQSCIVEHSLQLLKSASASAFIQAEIASTPDYKLQVRQIERWIWVAQRCHEMGDKESLRLLIDILGSQQLFGIVHKSEAGLTPQVKAIHTRLRALVDVEKGNLSRDDVPPLRERLFEHEITETIPLAYDLVVRAILNPVVKALLTDFRFVQRLDASDDNLDDLIRRLNETSAKHYDQPQDELHELFDILSELKIGFTYAQLAHMQIANRQLYAERSIKQEFDARLNTLNHRKDILLDDYTKADLDPQLTADLAQWSRVFSSIDMLKTRVKALSADVERLSSDLQLAKLELTSLTDSVSKAKVVAIDAYLKEVELLLIPVGQVKSDINGFVSKGVSASAKQFILELKSLQLFVQMFPKQMEGLNAQADDLVKLQQHLQQQGKELTADNQHLLELARYSIAELSRNLQEAIEQSAKYMLHMRKGSLSEETNPAVIEAISLHRDLQRLLVNEKLASYERDLFLCADKLTGVQHNIDSRSTQSGQVLHWLNRSDLQRQQGGEHWEQQYNGSYDFTVSKFSAKDSDLTGTNGQLEIRVFTAESYYQMMSEDFLLRLSSAHQALLTLVDDSLADKDVVLQWIDQQYNNVKDRIEVDCWIVPPVSSQELAEKIKIAQDSIHQYLINVLNVIEPNTPIKEALAKVSDAESKAVTDADRSNVIHSYEVSKFNGHGTTTRFSAFQSLGGGTIPSTERTLPQLANFAQRSCGYRDEKTGLWQVQFVGLTHSSYPLIGLSNTTLADKIQRRYGAAQAVEELITELARQRLAGQNPADYADEPLVVSLSTMALFSPIPQDRRFMGGDSEQRQLKETNLALQMFQHRTFEHEFVINGETYTVKIKPDITIMNAPANGLSAITKMSGLQDQINLGGFDDFTRHVSTYITEHLATHLRLDSEKDQQSVSKIAALWEQLSSLQPDDSQLKNDIAKLNGELEAEYQELYSLQKKIAESAEDTNLSDLHAEYEAKYKLIKTKEDALTTLYKRSFKQQKAAFKKQQAEVSKLYSEVCEFIQYSNDASWAGTEAGKQLKEIYQIIQLYIDCQNLYFSGKLTSKEHLHEFQTRYALLNFKIERFVEAFCKSAEDRTGRLINRLEEFCAFERDFGFYPRLGNKKDLEKLDDIAKTVLEFSTARELAGKNVPGARGLQQSEKLRVNQALPVKTDKAVATTAKGIYRVDAAIKPNHNYSLERICLLIRNYLDKEAFYDLSKIDQLLLELKSRPASKTRPAQAHQIQELKQELAEKYLAKQAIDETVTTMNHYFLALQRDISENEMLNTNQYRNAETSPNMAAYIDGCDNLALYVARSILTLDDVDLRLMKLEYWLQVANQCFMSGNYAAASVIMTGGIKNCAIDEDERLMSALSDEAKIIFAKLDAETTKHALIYSYEHENQPIIPFVNTLTAMLAPLSDRLNEAALAESSIATRMLTILKNSQQTADAYDSPVTTAVQAMLSEIAKEGDAEADIFDKIDALVALRKKHQAEEVMPVVNLDNDSAIGENLSGITKKYQAIYLGLEATYQDHQRLLASDSDVKDLVATLDQRIALLPTRRNLVTQHQRSLSEDCLPEISEIMSMLSDVLSKLSSGIYADFNRLDAIMVSLKQFGIIEKHTDVLTPFSDIHAKFSQLNQTYTKGDFHEQLRDFKNYLNEQLNRLDEIRSRIQENLARADEQSVTKPQQRVLLLESLRDPQYARDIINSLANAYAGLADELTLLEGDAAVLGRMTIQSELSARTIAAIRVDSHISRVEAALEENTVALERITKLLQVYNADDFYGHDLHAYLEGLETEDPLLNERQQLVENLTRIQRELTSQREQLIVVQQRTGATDAKSTSDIQALQVGFHHQALSAFKTAKYKPGNFIPTALLEQKPETLSQKDVYKLQTLQNQLLVFKQITLPMMESKPEQLKLTSKQTAKLLLLEPLLADNVQQGAFVDLYRLLSTNLDSRIVNLVMSLEQLIAKQQDLQLKLTAATNNNDLSICFKLERELQQDYSILQEQLPRLQSDLSQQLSTAQQMHFVDDVLKLKQAASQLDSASASLAATVEGRKQLSSQLQQQQRQHDQLQRIIQQRILAFLNPNIREIFNSNPALSAKLASDDFSLVRVIMMNNVPMRSRADIQEQFAGIGISNLTEQDLQLILDGQDCIDRVWQLQNSHLRNLILSSPEQTDLSQLRAGDLELLNTAGRADAAVRLLQQRGIIRLDETMQTDVNIGYQRLALSRLCTNHYIRDLIANDKDFQLPGVISQSDIKQLNAATVTAIDDNDFKAILLRIIGNEACLRFDPQISFATENMPTPLEKILTENRRLIVLNTIKLPVLRDYLNSQHKTTLHSRDAMNLSEDTQLAIAALNDLRSYSTMTMHTLQKHMSTILVGTIDDPTLLKQCEQQANIIMAMPRWTAEQSYYKATIESLAEAAEQHKQQWQHVKRLAQYTGSATIFKGSSVIDKIYALSSSLSKLKNFESELRASQTNVQDAYQQLVQQQAYFAAELSDAEIRQLAIELQLEPTQVLVNRRQHLDAIEQQLEKLATLGREQSQQLDYYQTSMSTVYTQLMQESASMAQYFGGSIAGDTRGRSSSLLSRSQMAHLRDMSADEKARHYASLASILLPCLQYLNDAQRKQQYAWNVPAEQLAKLLQLLTIVEQKVSTATDKQQSGPAPDVTRVHASPLLSSLVTESTRNTTTRSAPQFTVAENSSKPTRKGSAAILVDHPDFVTSFDQLGKQYQQFDLNCSAQSVKYFSKQAATDLVQRRQQPLYFQERKFVFDAISALISQRADENLYDAVVLGGKDQVLVNQAYAVVKALGLPVQFDSGVMVFENEDIRRMIAEFEGIEKLQEFKRLLFTETPTEPDLSMDNGAHQPQPVPVA